MNDMHMRISHILGFALALIGVSHTVAQVITTTPVVRTLNIGSVLSVNANASGGYVTMNVNLSFSQLQGFSTFSTMGMGGPATIYAPGYGGFGGSQWGLPPFGSYIPIPTAGRGGPYQARPLTIYDPPTRTRAQLTTPLDLHQPLPIMAAGTATTQPQPPAGMTIAEFDKSLLKVAIPAFRAEGVTLGELVKKLSAEHKVNLALGFTALKAQGLDLSVRHDFAHTGTTLRDVLLTMQTQYFPNIETVVLAEDNLVSVTTQTAADVQIITRTYYYVDVLAAIPQFVPKEQNLNQLTEARAKAAGITTPVKTKPRIETSIEELIVSSIRPEIWRVNGGKFSALRQVGDKVIVTAPLAVHALINGPKVYNPNAAPLYVNYGQ